MKISLVIPAYNEEKKIRECLASVKTQTRQPDEVVLIDNNCKDRTVEIAREVLPDIKIILETKQGMIPARNRGFNESKGELIARIDSDTNIPKNWIEHALGVFEKEKGIVGLVGPLKYNDGGLDFLPAAYKLINKSITGFYTLHGPGMVITRSVWEKVKSTVTQEDKKVHEDVDLSFNVSEHGEIYFDEEWETFTSARRMKYKPHSMFIEYTIRYLKTLFYNRDKLKKVKIKR